MAGDHWAGVGVLVAAKEGAWLLRPSRAPEKVALIFMFETMSTFWGWRLIQWRGLLVQMKFGFQETHDSFFEYNWFDSNNT